MILRLPVPTSPNRHPTNGFALQRAKDEYRKRAWIAAIQQHRPSQDPPAFVTVHAMFLLAKERDDDGCFTKWVWDALRQRQQGKCKWRQGLFPTAGYFIDDSPKYMKLGDVWQEGCGSKDAEELIVEILAS